MAQMYQANAPDRPAVVASPNVFDALRSVHVAVGRLKKVAGQVADVA